MKLLLYCTKAKPYITQGTNGSVYPSCVISDGIQEWHLNGKIVAECDFEVEEIEHYIHYEPEVDVGIAILPSFESEAYHTNTTGHFELLKQSCLTEDELFSYLNGNNGYAIHIKNLHIFDEPKELSECEHFTTKYGGIEIEKVEKAPQNMMYVMLTEKGLEDCVLISIQPQWLCKILNGEKTIEIRKKALKEMVK